MSEAKKYEEHSIVCSMQITDIEKKLIFYQKAGSVKTQNSCGVEI